MDPKANIAEQKQIAQRAIDAADNLIDRPLEEVENDLERLSDLVLALDEWRANGGFDPYAS